MPVWAKRDFADKTYLYTLDLMDDQQIAFGETSEFMMVRTGHKDYRQGMTTVFIRVPDPALVAAYQGFKNINDVDLPHEAVLLYGDLREFRKLFRDPPP